MTDITEPISQTDVQFGPYQVLPSPRAMFAFASGSACTIATLLCIPDAFALIPSAADPLTWFLRILGMWLSAFILWSFSFMGLLYFVRLLSGGILLDCEGLRLWRFGKRIAWGSIKAVGVEPQPVFSRLFCLKPVACRLTIYQEKPGSASLLPEGTAGSQQQKKLVAHHIPSFQFLSCDFVSLFAHICRRSFHFLPDAANVLVARADERKLLKKTYERGRWQRLALSAFIALSLLSFLGRKAVLNYTFNLGNKDFRSENYLAAARNYQMSTAVDPFFAPAFDQLARSEFRLGRTAEAEEHWLRALARKPDMVESKLGLSNIYMQRRQFAKARKLLEQSIRLAPRYTAAYMNLAELNLRLGRYPEAAKLAGMVLKQNEADARANGLLAQALLKLGDANEAAMVLEDARMRDGKVSSFPFVRLVSGEILTAQGRMEEAAGIFEELLGSTPSSLDVLLDLSRVRIAQGRIEEAQSLLARAAGLSRDDPWPLILQAQLALMLNDQDKARELLQTASGLPGQDAQSLASCGKLFAHFKDDEKANLYSAKSLAILNETLSDQ